VSEDHFLKRWADRKRRVAAQENIEPVAGAEDPAAHSPEQQKAAAAEAEEATFDLAQLPKIEDLTPASDLSLFMRKGVPEALRNAALRHIWTLDPAIRDYRSEAIEYAYDWNAPGGVPGGAEIGPEFDSREMVARIFGDPLGDENVIADAAAQKEAPETAEIAPEKAEEPASEPIAVAENPAESQINRIAGGLSAEPSIVAAPHNRRRHGSAAPAFSEKTVGS
jgi:hypothetical protein